MDFSYQYTEEQQEFRREVSDRLKRIVPDDVSILDTPSTAGFETIQQIRKMLGANGWLAAADSQETRGAGLTADHNVVILEELKRLEEKLEEYELGEFASVHHFQHSLERLSHQGGAHLAVADVKLQGPGHPVQAGADTRGHPEFLP